jgi:PAS domain S-box-containing protein
VRKSKSKADNLSKSENTTVDRGKGKPVKKLSVEKTLQHYEILARHGRDIVLFIRRSDGHIVEANEAAVKAYGYSQKKLLSLTIQDLRTPASVELTESQMDAADSAGTLFETEHRRKDGSIFAAEVSSQGMTIDGERILVSVIRDISERRQREEELHRLNRTLLAVSNSSQAMMRWQEDEQAYLDAVCKIIVEDCGHKMAWVGYAEEDKAKSVKPIASAGFEEGYLETLKITWADTERGRGPTGTAIRTGKVSMCRNMLTDSKFEPWRKEAIKRGYASSIVFPLKNVHKIFGALTIYSKQPDPFTEDEVKLLTELANDLAYGITTIRLHAVQKRTEEAQRKRAEEALRMSEEEFRSLAEAMPQIVWATRPDGWNIYFNQQWVEYTGMTMEESHGHGWNTPFHPDDKQRAWEDWQRATQHNERYSL